MNANSTGLFDLAFTGVARSNSSSDLVYVRYLIDGQLDPNDVTTRSNFGVALARMQQFPQAMEQFQAVLSLDPNNVDAHNNLGSIYLVAGQFPQAMAEYQTALRLNPNFANAQTNLARAKALDQARGRPAPPP